MTGPELELRREILNAFSATGAPPPPALYAARHDTLAELERRHVVVLREGRIHMAHPFAAHRERARVVSGGREWWGNCAWDGLGIAAALSLRQAVVESDGVTLRLAGGQVVDDALFHVAVPAARWWDDIGFT